MISAEIEELVKQYIIPGDYTQTKRATIQHFLQKHNIAFKYFSAIRSNHMLNKIIKHSYVLHKHLDRIIKEYEQGKSIVNLSKKFDVPPCNLLRAVEKQLKRTINEDVSSYDRYTCGITQKENLKKSEKFEERVGNVLRNRGIRFKTQVQLIKENISPTPDFLLDTPLVYDGIPIIWIDAKYMFGGNNSFTRNVLEKQNTKYEKHFGKGLFVFRYSYSEALVTNSHLTSFSLFRDALHL